MSEKMKFDNDNDNKWCPGCSNFLVLEAMKKAFAKLGLNPRDILIVSGIGQAGKTPQFINCNMFHGLHGRTLPVATGVTIANHGMNIIVSTGDGDCYGEGGNHFMAAIRRNIDITLLVHNNMVYGLTKGQASPTSPFGMKTRLQSQGTSSVPFNPIQIALVLGAGFVAQGFSGDTEHLSELICEAVSYRGFSLVDIFQPCVSFNRTNTHVWYKERIFDLQKTDHDASDYEKALKASHVRDERIPIGIFYRKPGIPFHERIRILKEKPLFQHGFDKSLINDILNRI